MMKKTKKKMGRPPVDEKKVKYVFYLPPSFMKKVKKLADADGLTSSRLVHKVLAGSLKLSD